MALVGHVHARRTHTTRPCPADGTGFERLEQDGELSGVAGYDRYDTGQRDLVLELVEIDRGKDNGRRQPEHLEAGARRPGVISHENNVSLAKRGRGVLLLVVAP